MLNHRGCIVIIGSTVRLGPLLRADRVRLDEHEIKVTSTETTCPPSNHQSFVDGMLNHRGCIVIIGSTVRLGPLLRADGVRLDEHEIKVTSTETTCLHSNHQSIVDGMLNHRLSKVIKGSTVRFTPQSNTQRICLSESYGTRGRIQILVWGRRDIETRHDEPVVDGMFNY